MPRGGKCTHPECLSWGEGCRQLTDEELTPTPEDVELGKQLVADGWYSVSTKYRAIRRWRTPPPAPEDVVRPEFADSFFGKIIIGRTRHWSWLSELRAAPEELTETRELTIRQWKAFKMAGGVAA